MRFSSPGATHGCSFAPVLPVRHHLSDLRCGGSVPAAVCSGAFTGLGAAACVAMLVFVLMLIEGLAWAWAKGVLTWE